MAAALDRYALLCPLLKLFEFDWTQTWVPCAVAGRALAKAAKSVMAAI